jgi:rod shape determining protein RodA
MSTALTPKPHSPATSWGERLHRLHIDPWLVSLLASVGVLGLVILYSASGQSLAYVIAQLQRLLLGFSVMVLLAQVPPEFYRTVAPWLYGSGTLLLMLTLVLGDHAKGAQRWLDLGVLRFQPSEIMKLAMPMMVAAYLHGRPLPPSARDVFITLAIIGFPAGLIAVQPDLGTGLLVIAAGMFALYLAGLSWRWIASAVMLVAAAAPLLWFKLHDYQRNRVLTFLDPERDPLGTGYHITQSKIAIGSGGAFGKGWLNGTQAKLDFLPESHTDFIFAVFSEELGSIGVILLLTLYCFVVGRGLFIALRGHDTFQRLLAGSLSLTFFIYVFINMGMVMGLMPVVGVPLPLLSYGGTSAVTLLAGFGMLMSIHTHRKLLTS